MQTFGFPEKPSGSNGCLSYELTILTLVMKWRVRELKPDLTTGPRSRARAGFSRSVLREYDY